MQDTGQGAGRIARTGGATKEAVAASRARQGSFVAALGFQAQRLLDRILLDAGIAASSPETSSGATAPQRRPDGRPLYLYPVADEVFALLGESSRRALEACQDRGGRVPDWLCQLVVFYGAHWFRRRGEGRIQRWDDLGILPEGFDPVPRSELVRRGLGLWGLSVVKTSQRREWLHTLALNGGIPARVLAREGRTGGWANRFFDACARDPRLGSVGAAPEAAARCRVIVETHSALLPGRYRHIEILDQAARLLAEVARWRRVRPDGLGSADAEAWMDVTFPQWRDVIPLHVGTQADAATVGGLLARLLTVATAKPDRGLAVVRGLELVSGVAEGSAWAWRDIAAISVDGSCAGSDFGLGGYHCGETFDVHAVVEDATGPLASRRVGRAHLEDALGGASLHCRGPHGDGVAELGEAAPGTRVRVELHQPGKGVHALCKPWRGAAPVREAVRLYSLSPEPDSPGLHRMLGEGSVSTGEDAAYLVVGGLATVRPSDGADIEELGYRDTPTGGERLWRLRGRAVVEVPDGAGAGAGHYTDDDQGRGAVARFRVSTAAHAEAAEHVLDVTPFHAPTCHLHEGDRQLSPAVDSRVARALRNGHEVPAEISVWPQGSRQGRQTLTWRDAEGFVLARRKVLALPTAFAISARRDPSDSITVELSWEGLAGWRLAFGMPKVGDGEAPETTDSHEGSTGRLRLRAPRAATLEVRLTDPQGRSTRARLDVESRSAFVRDRDGRNCTGEATTLSGLFGLAVHLPRAAMLELRVRAARLSAFVQLPKGYHPVGLLHGQAQALLAMAPQRNAVVEIAILNGKTLASVSRTTRRLAVVGGRVSDSSEDGPGQGAVVFRPLTDPTREYRGTKGTGGSKRQTLNSLAELGTVPPPDVAGPCLAYLRDGNRVLTRPVVVKAERGCLRADTRLGTLALLEDEALRRERMAAHLSDPRGEGFTASVRQLTEVAQSLRGLEPRALDMLAVLPRCPDALCAMLVGASPQERSAVLALSDGLAFMWEALPHASWQSAMNTLFHTTLAALQDLPGIQDPVAEAFGAVSEVLSSLSADAPWMAAHLDSIRHPPTEGLATAVGARIGTFIDLMGSAPQVQLLDALDLPELAHRFAPLAELDHVRNPAVLTPLVLAAQSRGRAQPSPQQAVLMRAATSADPEFVHGAYHLAMHGTALWED